jgi:predicted CXXCH cytochrome family protein
MTPHSIRTSFATRFWLVTLGFGIGFGTAFESAAQSGHCAVCHRPDDPTYASCYTCHLVYGTLLPRGAQQESLCKTCHNPTGEASSKSAVANHVVNNGATVIDCGCCHSAHGPHATTDPRSGLTTNNLALIRGNISRYVPQAADPVVFHSRPEQFSFDNAPFAGICQSCHTNTIHHRNDGTDPHHQQGQNCTGCHPHGAGFLPAGGTCSDCHNQGRGGRRQIVGAGGDFNKNSHHVAGQLTSDDCTVCHVLTGHPGSAVKLRHPDTGATIIHDPAHPEGLEGFCLGCHDADGATAGNGRQPFSDGRTVPNIAGGVAGSWTNSAHHLRPFARNGGRPLTCFGDGETGGCHNAHGSDNERLVSDTWMMGSIFQTCFQCHDNRYGSVTNNAISGSGLANNIYQSFMFGGANKHDLTTGVFIGTNRWELECTTCHNPHFVTGRYGEADQDKSPITRPDFSDPVNNPRAVGTNVWGDVPGEKMAAYGGTYRTPAGDRFSGTQLPDYVTFCLDCHEPMPSPAQFPIGHGQLNYAADPHGLNSANSPNGKNSPPNWFACGQAAGWNGDDRTGTNAWPVIPRGRGDQIWSREPYNHEDRIAGTNFVLSCTDCHEAHGSSVRSLIRTNPNGGSGTTTWNTMCNNCHYYYSDWHAGMSCASASCHVSDRMSQTGTDSIHRMANQHGDGSTRTFNFDLVLDLRFENSLRDSGTWRMHSRWFDTNNGSFASGRFGQAIVLNGDQAVQVGTENDRWSTDEGYHGTWKYTEMKYHTTLEAWVYPTEAVNSEYGLFTKHTGYANGGYAFVLKSVGGTLRAAFNAQVDTNGFAQGGAAGVRGAFSSVAIPLDRWTHVAATFSADGPDRDPADPSVGRIRIYVNGEDVTTSSASGNDLQPGPGESSMFMFSENSPWNDSVGYNGSWCASEFSVGGFTWQNGFVGRIDEAKVWNITKNAAYFALVDPLAGPFLSRVEGIIGSDRLIASFSEGVRGTGAGGQLVPTNFTLTCTGKTLSSVLHTPGERVAALVLNAPVAGSERSACLSVAARTSVVDEYANPAATDPVSIAWGCAGGPVALQFAEAAGSATIRDDSGAYVGTVNDPAQAILGDGYFHGDGVNNFVAFDNQIECFKATRTMTLEYRLRPAVVDGGGASTIQRVFAKDGDNYQSSVWRNTGWPAYQPPVGVASVAFWLRVADTSDGRGTWRVVLTDYADYPVVANHWYMVRIVWNSAKAVGLPCDIFVDDQGTDGNGAGENWTGYRNCTKADQAYTNDSSKLYSGAEILSADGRVTIGASNTGTLPFNGLMDWAVWQDAADYSGVDNSP